MRATPAAVYFAAAGRAVFMDAARRLSTLMPRGPGGRGGAALFHAALQGDGPLDALPDALPHRLVRGALRAAMDLGGDTDTVAAVTGGLPGAAYGADAKPEHWVRKLYVPLPGFGDRVLRVHELRALAEELLCTAVGSC